MKTLFQIIAIIFIFTSCLGQKDLSITKSANESVNDSIEYELLVFDTGFENWYLLYSKPETFRNQSYYEYWNQLYVQAWNYEKT